MWFQREIIIDSKKRGFHIITEQITSKANEIKKLKVGILYLFIKHTSASLTINENADHTVRSDFENHFNYLVPEKQPYYQHTYEGSDDMPAHLKSSLLGAFLTVPIKNGRLELGTWQGIYLCEHRDSAPERKIIVTIQGN
tara:strand:+ start:94 stop:513 length:420 start_codon:yes stop_codon:yes gene_type:complete